MFIFNLEISFAWSIKTLNVETAKLNRHKIFAPQNRLDLREG